MVVHRNRTPDPNLPRAIADHQATADDRKQKTKKEARKCADGDDLGRKINRKSRNQKKVMLL
jgi:hypothetical protein